jgi:hypothetical protein
MPLGYLEPDKTHILKGWGSEGGIVGFVNALNRQAEDNHREIYGANQRKRRLFQQSPALGAMANVAPGLPWNTEPETEAECQWAINQLTEELAHDPLVQRYANHLSQGSRASHNNTEWWHAFGHQQMAAVILGEALTRDELDRADKRLWDAPDSLPTVWDPRCFPGDSPGPFVFGPREASFEWMGRALDAQTYLWHYDTLEAACFAPLPEHVFVPNALPFTNMFFSFESAAFVGTDADLALNSDKERVVADTETWWCLITRMADAGAMLLFDKQVWPSGDYQGLQYLIMEPLPFGARWPQDFAHRKFTAEIGYVLRMLAFMQAPFVDAAQSPQRLPRPIRREYERAHKEAPEKACSIITLRRPLHEPTYSTSDSEAPSREFKHSWWVSGHYRWQYYPSTNDHKLVAISPYMKQIGKPLLRQLWDVKQ